MMPKSFQSSGLPAERSQVGLCEDWRPPFQKTNSLLCRDSPSSHKIVNLTKKEQNIELMFIIVQKQAEIRTKSHTIVQCLIADESASIYMNFFNQTGALVEEGDIIYASGVYLSSYRDMLLLYEGAMSIIKRLGRHFFRFNLTRNMSLESVQALRADNDNGSNNFKKY